MMHAAWNYFSLRISRRCLAVVLILAGSITLTAAELQVGEVVGVVRLRGGAHSGLSPVQVGDPINTQSGVALVSGLGARVELLGPAGERWRIGSLALWIPLSGGGRLLSGTILVEVPAKQIISVDSTTGRAKLGSGLWMVQATENEGLKLICLDGPGEVIAGGGTVSEDAGVRLTLQPGELTFLKPGGLALGPVVTIFLQELLVTSRLVNGFAQPLPQSDRLRLLAQAQSERLKRVTNAFVAGAKDGEGFQLMVPRSPPAQRHSK